MKIDLEHLKRYKDIALLFIKYGRSDIIKQASLENDIGGIWKISADHIKLGSSFIESSAPRTKFVRLQE